MALLGLEGALKHYYYCVPRLTTLHLPQKPRLLAHRYNPKLAKAVLSTYKF